MTPEELEYANKQADYMRDLMQSAQNKDDAIRAGYSDRHELQNRLDAAEARCADLVESNREAHEAIETLRAERDREQASAKSSGEMWAQADALYKRVSSELIEAGDTIRTLRASLAAEEAAHRDDVAALRAALEKSNQALMELRNSIIESMSR